METPPALHVIEGWTCAGIFVKFLSQYGLPNIQTEGDMCVAFGPIGCRRSRICVRARAVCHQRRGLQQFAQHQTCGEINITAPFGTVGRFQSFVFIAPLQERLCQAGRVDVKTDPGLMSDRGNLFQIHAAKPTKAPDRTFDFDAVLVQRFQSGQRHRFSRISRAQSARAARSSGAPAAHPAFTPELMPRNSAFSCKLAASIRVVPSLDQLAWSTREQL